MNFSKFFNAHHSPIGACATFTLGSKGASGGFGIELGGPARQNVYIGIESRRRGHFEALPFFAEAESLLKTFGIQDEVPSQSEQTRLSTFDDASINRRFTVATDTWNAGNLTFTLYSPISELPDPSQMSDCSRLQKALLPALIAELEIDNKESDSDRYAFFGFSGDSTAGMHHVDDRTARIKGIGNGTTCLICTDHPDAITGIGFGAEEILSRRMRGQIPFSLGNTGLLIVKVPPKTRATVRFALCFYKGGVVTTGIQTSYWYSQYYKSILDVAKAALGSFTEICRLATLTDAKYAAPHLSAERSFMLAHALRSYYGSTQLLDAAGTPLWVVNEGEYRMINTLDLTIDHLFHELAAHPWTVRNTLDWYADRYVYDAGITEYERKDRTCPGGISFTHDMGVANGFADPGTSAYEQPGKSGCFSYMTHEQLVNWIIVASLYIEKCNDESWACRRKDIIVRCFESLVNRDAAIIGNCKGYMQKESSLVEDGHEITTYDSLDSSLGRAKASSYGTLKRWAAFLLLHKVFTIVGEEEKSRLSLEHADIAASAIVKKAGSDNVIPAFLDGTDAGDILSLVEGLVYPWFAELAEVDMRHGRYAMLVACLKRHAAALLDKDKNVIADGGWKLSSSSDITWLSKLYLFRFISTNILEIVEKDEFVRADKAHCSWLLDTENCHFAWSDQFCNGKIIGSRYYPRGVTSVLWLAEFGNSARALDDKETS